MKMNKYPVAAFLMLILGTGACSRVISKNASLTVYPESTYGWKLGAQAYTFNRFSFTQALDKIDSCDLEYVEAYPSQKIGTATPGTLDYKMDTATRAQVLEILKAKGITLMAYGVVRPGSEAEWRQLFEFGKAMGIQTFTVEPDEKDLDLLSSLCDQYSINAAIHNHPQPSHYWNPDVVLAAINGKSKRLGACADIGHWLRSGLNPVECLKKLEGHVLHSHMKDLNEKNNKKAHDVPWGSGECDIAAVIAELKRQKFSGMISAEYEYNWTNSVPDVKASIAYFRKTVK